MGWTTYRPRYARSYYQKVTRTLGRGYALSDGSAASCALRLDTRQLKSLAMGAPDHSPAPVRASALPPQPSSLFAPHRTPPGPYQWRSRRIIGLPHERNTARTLKRQGTSRSFQSKRYPSPHELSANRKESVSRCGPGRLDSRAPGEYHDISRQSDPHGLNALLCRNPILCELARADTRQTPRLVCLPTLSP